MPKSNWQTVLSPYIRSHQTYYCPSDTSIPSVNVGNADREINKGNKISYAVNGWAEYHLEKSEITHPENWILLAEYHDTNRSSDGQARSTFSWWTWQGGNLRVWPPTASPDPSRNAAKELAITRHEDRANWLYADGHIKRATLLSLCKPSVDNPFWPNPPK